MQPIALPVVETALAPRVGGSGVEGGVESGVFAALLAGLVAQQAPPLSVPAEAPAEVDVVVDEPVVSGVGTAAMAVDVDVTDPGVAVASAEAVDQAEPGVAGAAVSSTAPEPAVVGTAPDAAPGDEGVDVIHAELGARKSVALVEGGAAPGEDAATVAPAVPSAPAAVSARADAGVAGAGVPMAAQPVAPRVIEGEADGDHVVASPEPAAGDAEVTRVPARSARWAEELQGALLRRVVFLGDQRRAAARDVAPPRSAATEDGAESEAPVRAAVVAAVEAQPSADGEAALGQESGDTRGEALLREPTPTVAEKPVRAFAVTAPDTSAEVSGAVGRPAPPASTSVDAPAAPRALEQVRPAEITQFVVRHVRVSESDGVQTWTIRLVPESLGDLKIEVTRQNNEIAIRLLSNNSVARETMEGQLHRLHEALVREGVEVTRVVVASQSPAGSQLLAGDAGGHGGRAPAQPGQTGSSAPHEGSRAWQGSGGDAAGSRHQPPRRERGGLDLWA